MKRILLPTLMLLCINAASQRFLPVMQSTDAFESISTIDTDKILDAEIFEGNLLVGGDFSTIINEDILNLAVWDGSTMMAFSPAPEMDGGDRINRIFPYNNGLIIFGQLEEYNDAAIFDGTGWTTMGWNNANDIKAMTIFDGTPYVIINGDEGPTSVQKYIGGNWILTSQPFSGDMQDITTFNDRLVITYELNDEILLEFYDGQTWTTQFLPEDFDLTCLSVVDESLYACGRMYNADLEIDHPEILVLNEAEEFVPSGIQLDAGLIQAGHMIRYGDGFFIGNHCRSSGNLLNPGPAMTSYTLLSGYPFFPFGVNEIITFNGAVYSLLGNMSDWHKPFSLIEDGLECDMITNNILAPSFMPGATSLRRPNNIAGLVFPDSNDPSFSTRSTVYGTSPWMYGIDEGDTIISAATFFGLTPDICFGPMTNNRDMDFMKKYYRIWTLSASEITYHQTHHADAGYIPDVDIASWPAHGRTGTSEAEVLAPFVDIDGDNLYNPILGDYPHIKGDVCAYWMFHDGNGFLLDGDEDELPSPDSLAVETHVMAYLFNESDGVISNTLFYNYRMVNRSDRDYEKFHTAIWTDFDLGTSTDDYIGCDSILGFSYAYNADSFDEPSSVSAGYQEFPPAQGVLFLNQEMINHVYYNIGTNPINGDPSMPHHYFNYMNSQWKNGLHMLYGGNGVSGAGVTEEETDFMFPNYPWEEGWNEITSGNPGGDRRTVAAGEPFPLAAGDCFCFDLAFISARDTTVTEDPQLASLALLQTNVPLVKNFYTALNQSCSCAVVGLDEELKTSQLFHVYPNPGNDFITIRLPKEHTVTILNVTDTDGRLVKTMAITNSSTISMNDLQTGIYLISLQTENEFISTRWTKL